MASRLTHRLAAIACMGLLATMPAGRTLAQTGITRPAVRPPQGFTQSSIPDSLTLRAALDLALEFHPDLRVAAAELTVARADSAFANVRAFNPQLELQASRGGPSLGSGVESTLDLGLSQEFELWGKRDARQSVATARSQTRAAEWRAKLQDIESEVRARFEHALFLQNRVTLGEKLVDLDRRVVVATQSRVREGGVTPVTGRLTELDLLRLESQSRRVRGDLRQALLALGLAIGRELPDAVRLGGEPEADSLLAPEDSVVAIALRVRATGDVLRRQIVERRAERNQAEREGQPNLTLGLGLSRERRSFAGGDFSGAPAIVSGISGAQSTDHLWTARISAPLPLWQQNQAARARALGAIGRSEAEYDRYRLQTQLEVLGAVRRFEDATGLYRLYLERSTRVREDLVLMHEAYADGRIPLDSYLTQKGRLVDTLLAQLEAGDTYWDARGHLESTVGLDLAHLNAGGDR